MSKILAALKFLLLTSACFALISLGLLFQQARVLVQKSELDMNRLVPQVRTLLTTAQTTLDVAAWKVNGDGGSPQHPHLGPYDGILTKVYKDTKDLHQLEFNVSQQQLALYKQLNQDGPELMNKLKSSAGHLDATLAELPATVIQLRATLHGLQLDEESVQMILDDPELVRSLKHIEASSEHVEELTKALADTMKLVEFKVDQQVHPSKKARALGALLTALKSAYYLSFLVTK